MGGCSPPRNRQKRGLACTPPPRTPPQPRCARPAPTAPPATAPLPAAAIGAAAADRPNHWRPPAAFPSICPGTALRIRSLFRFSWRLRAWLGGPQYFSFFLDIFLLRSAPSAYTAVSLREGARRPGAPRNWWHCAGKRVPMGKKCLGNQTRNFYFLNINTISHQFYPAFFRPLASICTNKI